jgi:hypothetical protein
MARTGGQPAQIVAARPSAIPSNDGVSLTLTIELTPAQLDALADRVAERLRMAPAAQYVDAATLASRLGLSRDAVYAKAADLGGVKISDGPRPRWRFDLGQALEAWSGRLASERSLEPPTPASRAVSRRRRRGGKGSSPALLPVRGGEDAS